MAVTKQATPIDAQKRAAELLAEGMKYQDIADTLGVSRMTIWRWFHEVPDVTSYYLTLVNMKVALLKDSAIDFLRDALDDPDCPHAVKHAIARTILERCDKLEAVRDRTIGDKAEDDTNAETATWKGSPYQIKRASNVPTKKE
jgi:AcrR family transcriptional regulator